MLTRFLNYVSSPRGPHSAVLLQTFPNGRTVSGLHIVPEDSTIERFCYFCGSSAGGVAFLRYGGAVEQSREHVGSFTVPVDHPFDTFISGCAARAQKMIDNSAVCRAAPAQAGGIGVAQLVEDILKPLAHDAIDALGSGASESSMNKLDVETYHVYIVYIKRARPGRITTDDPTSSG